MDGCTQILAFYICNNTCINASSQFTEEWVFSKLDKYMTNEWESVTNFGEYLVGMPTLRKLVMQTLRAFPDIKLHIVDTYCEGKSVPKSVLSVH